MSYIQADLREEGIKPHSPRCRDRYSIERRSELKATACKKVGRRSDYRESEDLSAVLINEEPRRALSSFRSR